MASVPLSLFYYGRYIITRETRCAVVSPAQYVKELVFELPLIDVFVGFSCGAVVGCGYAFYFIASQVRACHDIPHGTHSAPYLCR